MDQTECNFLSKTIVVHAIWRRNLNSFQLIKQFQFCKEMLRRYQQNLILNWWISASAWLIKWIASTITRYSTETTYKNGRAEFLNAANRNRWTVKKNFIYKGSIKVVVHFHVKLYTSKTINMGNNYYWKQLWHIISRI